MAEPEDPVDAQGGTDTTTLLFVYGTLMPGRCRWGYVEPFVAAQRPAAVAGRLYDTGWDYQAARFAASARRAGDGPREAGTGAGTIEGWLLDLQRPRLAGALELLDEVEGDEYDRCQVTTADGAVAWSYE